MLWLSHKLRLLEDWTSTLSQEQVDALNSLHASESPSVQYWMREYGIQTLSPAAFEDAQFTAGQQEPAAQLSAPRTSNEAFEALFAERKKSFPEFVSAAESCVKEAVEVIEAQFVNYVSFKATKSKEKSGPIFDEFTAVDEIVLAMASNLKKFKPAAESVLDAFNKLTSLLQSFEKKMEAAVLKTRIRDTNAVSRSCRPLCHAGNPSLPMPSRSTANQLKLRRFTTAVFNCLKYSWTGGD